MASYEQSMDQLRHALVADHPQLGLEYFGIATNVIDITTIYIVPLSCYRVMSVLEKPGQLCEQVSEHALVVYFSPTLNQHARGIIQNVGPNKSCIIFAMDYGVMDEDVTPCNIFTLFHQDADDIPGLAQLCELSSCFPRDGRQFDAEAKECFKFFMGQEREKLHVTVKEISNHKLGVSIISSESNPDSVSRVLAYANHSVLFPAPL